MLNWAMIDNKVKFYPNEDFLIIPSSVHWNYLLGNQFQSLIYCQS